MNTNDEEHLDLLQALIEKFPVVPRLPEVGEITLSGDGFNVRVTRVTPMPSGYFVIAGTILKTRWKSHVHRGPTAWCVNLAEEN